MQSSQHVLKAIYASYSAKANEDASPTQKEYASKAAKTFGYDDEQLTLVEGANLGLGCGNPCAKANLQPGETVVDLGCGGGVDVILASRLVGKDGKVFGVDNNHDMIYLAQKNIEARHLSNVELVTSSITDLSPIPSRTVNCVISNSVINLVSDEDKHHVFSEAFRILKPGGRIVFCDIVEKDEMPDELHKEVRSRIGGVSGALDTDAYRRMLMDAGFSDIVMIQTSADLNIWFADAPPQSEVKNYDINDYAGACRIHAIRPLALI